MEGVDDDDVELRGGERTPMASALAPLEAYNLGCTAQAAANEAAALVGLDDIEEELMRPLRRTVTATNSLESAASTPMASALAPLEAHNLGCTAQAAANEAAALVGLDDIEEELMRPLRRTVTATNSLESAASVGGLSRHSSCASLESHFSCGLSVRDEQDNHSCFFEGSRPGTPVQLDQLSSPIESGLFELNSLMHDMVAHAVSELSRTPGASTLDVLSATKPPNLRQRWLLVPKRKNEHTEKQNMIKRRRRREDKDTAASKSCCSGDQAERGQREAERGYVDYVDEEDEEELEEACMMPCACPAVFSREFLEERTTVGLSLGSVRVSVVNDEDPLSFLNIMQKRVAEYQLVIAVGDRCQERWLRHTDFARFVDRVMTASSTSAGSNEDVDSKNDWRVARTRWAEAEEHRRFRRCVDDHNYLAVRHAAYEVFLKEVLFAASSSSIVEQLLATTARRSSNNKTPSLYSAPSSYSSSSSFIKTQYSSSNNSSNTSSASSSASMSSADFKPRGRLVEMKSVQADVGDTALHPEIRKLGVAATVCPHVEMRPADTMAAIFGV